MGRKGRRDSGLRTSREVADRIRWDPNLDERVFVVGYEERFSGLQERGFAEFTGQGEIPWHRVWHFRVGDLMVWSRAERIDRLFGSGQGDAEPERIREAIERARAVRSGGAGAEALRVLDVVRFDGDRGQWVVDEGGGPSPLPPRSLCVVSYNVLFDLYEPLPLHTARRIPALLSRLRREKADLVALQEVTPTVLEAILAEPWVREAYRCSEGPAGDSVRPYGQLLLSRWPMKARVREVREGGHKRVLYGDVRIGARGLTVAVVHLTSDRAKRAEAKRAEELALVYGDLDARGGARLVVGDFNADDEALEASRRGAGLIDAWRVLRPREAGATFDPSRNDLARHSSRSGKVRRLDRIWLGGDDALQPRDIERLGLRPEARAPGGRPLDASDHYGLRARLSWSGEHRGPAPDDAPVHRSAVVVIPPRAQWEPIQAIRVANDRAHPRWMPHVTLLYGFVPPERLDEAASVLREVLADASPFEVSLAELRHFEHRRRHTVWLEPRCEPAGALERLQQRLQAAFVQCDEQSRRGGFTPHLTVGQVPAEGSAETIARWQAGWTSPSFSVASVAVIVRRGDEPFVVHRVIPLGGARSKPAEAPPLVDDVVSSVASLRRAWKACVGSWPLAVVGSHRLGVAGPDADLDVVAFGPDDIGSAEVFARLPEQLRAQGHQVDARPIFDATVPRLALRVDGREVDVQHVRWPAEAEPPEDLGRLAEHPGRAGLDAASEHALLAVLDAEAMLEHAARHGGIGRFVGALRRLRRWAAGRDVAANALGFPGGLAWAVMLGRAAAEHPADPTDPRPDETLFRACVRDLSRRTVRDWSRVPIGLDPSGEGLDGEHVGPMVVVAPVAPSRNCTARATVSSVTTLEAELDRFDGDDEVVAPDPLSDHRWLVTVELRAPWADALGRARGIVMGRAAGLIRMLEQNLGAGRIRPYRRWWPLEPAEEAAVLLLGVTPVDDETPMLPRDRRLAWERDMTTAEGWPAEATVRLGLAPAADVRASSTGAAPRSGA